MRKFTDLWAERTRVTSQSPEDQYREYIARVTLLVIGLFTLVFTLSAGLNFIGDPEYRSEFWLMVGLDALIFLAYLSIRAGKWKLAGIIYTGFFLFTGIFTSFTGSDTIVGVFPYVLAILFAGMYTRPIVSLLLVFISTWIYFLTEMLALHGTSSDRLRDSICFFILCGGIAFIQRLAVNQLDQLSHRFVLSDPSLPQEESDHWPIPDSYPELLHEYQMIISHIQQDVFHLTRNEDGTLVLIINKGRILQKYGVFPDRLVGVFLKEAVPAEILGDYLPYIETAFQGEEVNYAGSRNGNSFKLLLTPVREDSPIREVVGTLWDTTEEKKQQREQEIFQQKIKFLFDHMEIGMIEVDIQGTVQSWNRAAELIFGFSESEIRGKNAFELLIPPPSRAEEVGKITAALKGSGSNRIISENCNHSGRRIQCEWVINPLFSETGQSQIGMCTIREVTAQLQAEGLQRAMYRISEASFRTQTLDEFYAEVHRIINDLISARNFYIAIHRPETDEIEYVYFVDEADAVPGKRKFGNGVTEYVLRTGEPALIDPERFEELVRQGEVQNVGVPSIDWLGVPLKDEKGVTFGVVAIQTYTEGERYNRTHLNILNFVSTQVASAIQRKQGAEQLILSEEKYRSFIEQTGDAMMLLDETGRVLEINHSMELLTGYSRQEIEGMYDWDIAYLLMPPEQRSKASIDDIKNNILNKVEHQGQKEIQAVVEIEVMTKDLQRRYLQQSVFTIVTPNSFHIGILSRDITAQKKATDELRQSEERFRRFLANQGESFTFLNQEFIFLYANVAADALFQVESGMLLGRSMLDFLDENQREKFIYHMKEVVQGEKLSFELTVTFRDQTPHYLLVTSSPEFNQANVYLGAITLFRDISESKMTEDRLRYFSMYDALTGIYNRAFFETEMKIVHPRDFFPVSFLMADVDNLKLVNDRQGHAKGDELLKQLAELLKNSIREKDIVARIGGDEFVIIFPGTAHDNAIKLRQRIDRHVKEHNQKDSELPIYLSMGVSTAVWGQELQRALQVADERMFREKAKKKAEQNRLNMR